MNIVTDIKSIDHITVYSNSGQMLVPEKQAAIDEL